MAPIAKKALQGCHPGCHPDFQAPARPCTSQCGLRPERGTAAYFLTAVALMVQSQLINPAQRAWFGPWSPA